jgi:hypothetical protein
VRTMRLAICVAIMLLTLPQVGQAQDTFNSNSGKAPCKTWQDRMGPCYANDPPPGPSDEPGQRKGPGVLLKGGVSVEDKGTGPGGPGGGQRGGAGIFEGGTLPPRTGAGVFGPQAPAGPVLQGGTGAAAPGAGGAPVLKGGVSQGQQGTPGYPPPTATTQPASRQPVFVGSKEIDKRTYTIRSEGDPGGAAWGAFTNPDRYYEGFYGQVERRGSGYIFRVTGLRLPGGGTKAANIEVPVKKVQ